MTCRSLFLSTLGTSLVIWFAVGCGTYTATPIPPTASLTQEPPTSTPTSTPTVAPGGFPRRFHVEGNAFVDQYSQTMVFRGMAPIDPILQALGPYYSEFGEWSAHHYQVMAEWGANIIRLPIVPDNLHNHGMDETLRILDQTVAWASEYQMYVIIDFHSVGWPPTNYYHPSCACNQTSKQEILDFWATISRHYADNDVVAFYELFNEPVTRAETQWYITGAPNEAEDWLAWKEFMEQVIAVIRVNDPEKIILVSGLQFAYDLEFVAEAPIADSNVAYATHPYANNSNLDWDTAFGNLSYRYPVIAAELGYEEPGNPDPDYNGIPYHQAIIDYFEAHHMSWTVWVFDATWDTSLLLDMQTYQPSLSGEYFRGRLLELNQRP